MKRFTERHMNYLMKIYKPKRKEEDREELNPIEIKALDHIIIPQETLIVMMILKMRIDIILVR